MLASKELPPIATFSPPVVSLLKAEEPNAVLKSPEVKSSKTSKPKPVLSPAVLNVPVPAS